jgi:two-component system response regulator FixJ
VRTISSNPAVVIAEDAAVRDSLTMLLETYGLAVRSYKGAAAYLDGQGCRNASCILAIFQTTCADGIEVVREARRLGIQTPAIILAAEIDPRSKIEASTLGATAIETPLAPEELHQAIRAILVD